MKYLKNFNESNKDFYYEVKEYIEDILLELVDYGCNGNVSVFQKVSTDEVTNISIYIEPIDKNKSFNLSNIENIILTIINYVKLKCNFKKYKIIVENEMIDDYDYYEEDDDGTDTYLSEETFSKAISSIENYQVLSTRLVFIK